MLNKQQLLDAVLSGLRRTGVLVTFLKDEHPFEVEIASGLMTTRLRIYVWNVTHGGGSKRPDDEQRVQITSVPIPLGPAAGGQELLCGVHEETGVLAVFDPTLHTDPSESSPSMQISETTLREAAVNGFAAYRRATGEVALAVRPDFLGLYLVNQTVLHDAATTDATYTQLKDAASGDPTLAAAPLPPPGLDARARVLVLVARAVRDADFRRRVLAAYRHSCAVCGTQLGLVEAAHIVPVAAPIGTDETRNGVALCVLHHRAYDRGLLGIFPDAIVRTDAGRLEELAGIGRAEGVQVLADYDGRSITLPAAPADHPDPDLLQEGLRVRGWEI